MSHSARGLNGAWNQCMKPVRDLDRERRISEDFQFLVLCQSKGNMAMYELLRDKSLDKAQPGQEKR